MSLSLCLCSHSLVLGVVIVAVVFVVVFVRARPLTPAAGPRSALGSAVGCGILLGVFEGEQANPRRAAYPCTRTAAESLNHLGVGVLMNRMFAQPIPPMQSESEFESERRVSCLVAPR